MPKIFINWYFLSTLLPTLLFLEFAITSKNILKTNSTAIQDTETICVYQQTTFTAMNIYLNVTILNILFCIFTINIFQLCFLWNYNEKRSNDQKNTLIFLMLLIALFTAENLVYFFILFESSLLPIFIKIASAISRNKKTKANYYLATYTFISGLAFLIALLLSISENNVLIFSELELTNINTKNNLIWFCLLTVFLIKTPTFPFHIWLPEAHVEATTQGSVILAAVLLKIGAFGLIKCNSTAKNFCISNTPLISTLCIMSIYIALASAITQLDVKRIVAYFSIAHMNVLVLGILNNNETSFLGSLILTFSHGFTSAGLFFCVGMLYLKDHSKIILYFSGLGTLMPIFCQKFLLLNFLNTGLPISSNFISELLIFNGLINNNTTTGILASLSVILTTSATVLTLTKILFGTVKTEVFICKIDLFEKENQILNYCIISTIILGAFPMIN